MFELQYFTYQIIVRHDFLNAKFGLCYNVNTVSKLLFLLFILVIPINNFFNNRYRLYIVYTSTVCCTLNDCTYSIKKFPIFFSFNFSPKLLIYWTSFTGFFYCISGFFFFLSLNVRNELIRAFFSVYLVFFFSS